MWGSGVVAAWILALALVRGQWLSFTHYYREQGHVYLLRCRLDGRQSRCGYCEGETKSLSRPGIKIRFLGRPACILIIISTIISRLPLSGVTIS